jgi:hypothetical protein
MVRCIDLCQYTVQMQGFSHDCNEYSDSRTEFLYQLNNNELLKNDSLSWSQSATAAKRNVRFTDIHISGKAWRVASMCLFVFHRSWAYLLAE